MQASELRLSLIKVKLKRRTFLVGECITGAGGDGGALGIFWLILQQSNID